MTQVLEARGDQQVLMQIPGKVGRFGGLLDHVSDSRWCVRSASYHNREHA